MLHFETRHNLYMPQETCTGVILFMVINMIIYKQTFGKRSLYKDVVVKISLDSTVCLGGL